MTGVSFFPDPEIGKRRALRREYSNTVQSHLNPNRYRIYWDHKLDRHESWLRCRTESTVMVNIGTKFRLFYKPVHRPLPELPISVSISIMITTVVSVFISWRPIIRKNPSSYETQAYSKAWDYSYPKRLTEFSVLHRHINVLDNTSYTESSSS